MIELNRVLFSGEGLFLIAGPCVIESDALCDEVAAFLKSLSERLNLPVIFKSSYDKANRSSVRSFRGPGLEEGLKVLEAVRLRYSLPVLTDVHSPEEARVAAEVVDVLQVPAFLCRQTDLVLATSETGKPVNVKKGQFLAPWDVKNIIEKFTSTGNKKILLTERGTTFGYNNLVVDMRGLQVMRSFGYPVVFDATHSVQLPGGQGSSSGGQREFVPALTRAAVAAGVDGLFMEVHPEPDRALCDGPNMLPLSELEPLLKTVIEIDRVVRGKM